MKSKRQNVYLNISYNISCILCDFSQNQLAFSWQQFIAQELKDICVPGVYSVVDQEKEKYIWTTF